MLLLKYTFIFDGNGTLTLHFQNLRTCGSSSAREECDGNHAVHLSYLEVYNETVRDLLSPGRPLVLREDKQVHFLIFCVI